MWRTRRRRRSRHVVRYVAFLFDAEVYIDDVKIGTVGNGMKQRELAEKVGINKNYLSHIESGSTDKVVSLPLLIRISKALNVEPALLVDIEDMKLAKNSVMRQMEEVKTMFEEVKRFSAELDRMMLEMSNFDPKKLTRE